MKPITSKTTGILRGGQCFSLAAPVLVGRHKGYCWFPTLMRLADGALLVAASAAHDGHGAPPTGRYSWSADGGRTWSQPLASAPFSECGVVLPSGDLLLLPYRLYPTEHGIAAPACLVPYGRRELRPGPGEVQVTDWPRAPQPEGDPARGELTTADFSFNGQVVNRRGGGYLATLYGRFLGERRYSLIAAGSPDGLHWSVQSIIADSNCSPPGEEGPSEAALTRLRDGRLLCVFRREGRFENVYDPASPLLALPYGMASSSNEGKSWSQPVPLAGHTSAAAGVPGPDVPGSVQPSLAILPGGGAVLSGGRPGLYLWFNGDGTGRQWEGLDLRAHHNMYCPEEPITTAVETSSYTEVVPLGSGRLLYVYDRLPCGWKPIPEASLETNSVWVVQISISPQRAG